MQDTFIKTWNYLAREGKIDLMKPFLYHILNCLIIDEYRRHKNFSLDALMSDGFDVQLKFEKHEKYTNQRTDEIRFESVFIQSSAKLLTSFIKNRLVSLDKENSFKSFR